MWVVIRDRHDRDERKDREQPLLAVAVGKPADHLRGDERREAAGEVDDRRSASATPTFATLYAAMNGITVNTDPMSTIMKANARR